MLVDPHEDMSLFNYEELEPEEVDTPMVFPLEERKMDSCSVVSFERFLKCFNIFTEGQLEGINWNNVLVAGG